MKRFKNILVSLDTRLEDHPILRRAAALAKLNDAKLKVVEIIPEIDTSIELPDHYGDIQASFVDDKQKGLEDLIAPFRKDGVQIESKLLVGRTSHQIIREILLDNHDLVMQVAKGKGSRRKGYFGATAMRLLRYCPCAVWLSTPSKEILNEHVLACVSNSDDSAHQELNQRIMELAASVCDLEQCKLSVLRAWSIWNEGMLRSRSPKKDMEWIEAESRKTEDDSFNKFLEKFGLNVTSENVHLVKGQPDEVISGFIQENNVDLVVLGTVARAGLSGYFMGNTAESVLDRIACSVLALKPAGFKTKYKV